MIQRRGFLAGMLALGAAPAIVTSRGVRGLFEPILAEVEALTPPRALWVPTSAMINGLSEGSIITIQGVNGLDGLPQRFTIKNIAELDARLDRKSRYKWASSPVRGLAQVSKYIRA